MTFSVGAVGAAPEAVNTDPPVEVHATLVAPDGSTTELEVELTTEPASRTRSGIQTYASTAKVITNTEDLNLSNIQATALLKMYWTDVPGIHNTIDRLEGNLTVNKGTFNNARLDWGGSCTRAHQHNNKSVGRSFAFDTSFTGPVLHAHNRIWFTDGSVLLVHVEPTIFD